VTTYVSPDTSTETSPQWRLLGRVPLLASLGEIRLRALWDASSPRALPGGDVLRHVGDPAAHLLILLHGQVAAEAVSAAGRTVRFGTWTGPCALDKVAVIDGGGHTATLRTLTRCQVRSLPRAALLELVDDEVAVRRHVLHILAAQARRQQDSFTAAATLPGEARLAAWLLNEAATGTDLTITITQQELGDRLGLSRVTINRMLSRLRRDGLIETAPRSIRILAPELIQLRSMPST
jgi:CRP/FNR family transcriptional regulator, cyclic AMP receptor protein